MSKRTIQKKKKKKNVIEKFNVYMTNATINYEAGYKLRNSYEALALSIYSLNHSFYHRITPASWL